VLRILHNPRYAGAFTFGRHRDIRLPGGKLSRTVLPREEWISFIPGAHPGYLTLEQYDANRARLAANAAAHGRDRTAGPPRVLRDAEDADEGGVHDADGKSDESGGVVSKVSATSARCLLDRSQGRTQQAGLCLRAGEAGQRAGGSREWRWRVSLPGTRSAAGPGSAP
jgi:hypothetical protein